MCVCVYVGVGVGVGVGRCASLIRTPLSSQDNSPY